jgi:hypothetical protein
MNGLVLCGTGPHYTVAFYALHVADAGRPWDQTLLPSPTCKGEQYNTMHHDTLALQKPWSHTPTHTVHIPQHRHLHTNTHVTNITNGNTSLTVWEKKQHPSASQLWVGHCFRLALLWWLSPSLVHQVFSECGRVATENESQTTMLITSSMHWHIQVWTNCWSRNTWPHKRRWQTISPLVGDFDAH